VGKLVLVQPGPGAPDLLPLEVWQALARPYVFLTPGDELGMRLADGDMPFAVLEEAAAEHFKAEPNPGKGPELRLLIAAHKHGETTPGAKAVAERLKELAAERGEITFVLPRDHGEEITRAVLEVALSGDPEVEVVMGRSAHGARLLELVRVMARLRGPDGCPWDREQTHQTLVKYLLDETYELIEAIESGAQGHVAEELGDLLLQVVFHAQMAADAGDFDVDDVAGGIVTKLITRHPHVFGDLEVEGASEVVANWEVIKDHEKGRTSVLEGVPEALPALAYATKLQKRAAKVGFDWDDAKGPAEKVREELAEIEAATPDRLEEEVGDMLFAAAALARKLGVGPETAVRRTSRKFRDRLSHMERAAAERGISLKDLSAEELDALWNEAK
jgi:MazG family protein